MPERPKRPTEAQIEVASRQASSKCCRYTEAGGVNEPWLVEYRKALAELMEEEKEKSRTYKPVSLSTLK